MFKLCAVVFIVSAFTTPTLVQAVYGPCGNVYQTTDSTGKPDTAAAIGTPCIPSAYNPSGDCELGASGATAVSAVCQLTYSTNPRSYICCFSVAEITFPTPGPGSTYSTLGPLTTPTPQFLKPRCPNGIPGSISSRTNVIKQCNITQSTSCPVGFTCRKAVNAVDVFGTVTVTDDLGAGLTPYLCCDKDAFTYYYKVFEKIGLYPTPMSWTTIKGIVSVKLGTKVAVSIGDDVSYMPGQLAVSPASITLLSKTSAASTTTRYHVYMFDSDNGKESMFFANIAGTGTTVLTLPTTTAAATAPAVWIQVYRSSQANALTMEVAAWKPTTFYLTARRWVVIVWQTTTPIVVGANSKTNTNLNLKKGLYGDFEPSTATATKGNYVNNTNIFTKLKSVLKTPIAATYFFAKS